MRKIQNSNINSLLLCFSSPTPQFYCCNVNKSSKIVCTQEYKKKHISIKFHIKRTRGSKTRPSPFTNNAQNGQSSTHAAGSRNISDFIHTVSRVSRRRSSSSAGKSRNDKTQPKRVRRSPKRLLRHPAFLWRSFALQQWPQKKVMNPPMLLRC